MGRAPRAPLTTTARDEADVRVAERLRVLITAGTFPAERGDGSPRFIWDLAHAISQRHDVMVLAPHVPGAATMETWSTVTIRRFTYFRPRSQQRLAGFDGMPDNLRRSWRARVQVPFFLVAQAAAVRRLVRTWRPHVINAHWIVPQGLTATRARIGSGPKVVLHAHGGDVFLLAGSRWGRAVARRVLNDSDLVFAAGRGLREQLARIAPSVPVRVQPMGVDISLFEAAAQESPVVEAGSAGYIAFVGRLTDVKGVPQLLQAFVRVRERHEGIELVVVGDGPERARLEQESRRLGGDGIVRFLGQRSQSDVANIVTHARALVVPSIVRADGRTEGMPTVVVEGMAAGTRVIATRVGGIPDVVDDGVNGWLCEPGDPEALAGAMGRALAEPDTPQARARIREAAQPFSWDAVVSNYSQAFDELGVSGG